MALTCSGPSPRLASTAGWAVLISKGPAVPKTEPGVTRVQVEEPAFDASTYLWAGSINVLGVMNRGIMVLFLT